ncbi:MAG: hypothetical protein ACK5ZG_13570 [Phycisphaerae bacterium]|jgi:hypothetical protein
MAITYRVVVPAEVELAIVAHAEYIAVQGGSSQNAARWIDAVESAVRQLATYPLRFPLAPDLGWYTKYACE